MEILATTNILGKRMIPAVVFVGHWHMNGSDLEKQ